VKRILSFVVLSFAILLPIAVSAAEEPTYKCTEADENNLITCVANWDFNGAENASSANVKLTEHGGAELQAVTDADNTDWSVNELKEDDWTFVIESPGLEGAHDLFKFSYVASGQTGCKIGVNIAGTSSSVAPDNNKDDKAPQKDTGATLPYIALGSIALIAVGAYLATKGKSKLYKI